MTSDSLRAEDGNLECEFSGIGTMGVSCQNLICRGTRSCVCYGYLTEALRTVQRERAIPFHEPIEPALIAYGY